MSLQHLTNTFEEAMLSFVWRQWGQMGVSAPVGRRDAWCQDPEALLLFSLEVARREPRIFDEVLDWLGAYGSELMRQRLQNLLRDDPHANLPLVSAAMESAKLPGLIPAKGKVQPPPHADWGAVFEGPHVRLAEVLLLDPVFLAHDLRRPPFHRSSKSSPPSLSERVNFGFRLRAAFGPTTRAEVIRCLLLRPGREHGTAEIAALTSLSRVGVHQALDAFARAGLCETAQKGRKDLIWWVEASRWREWLGVEPAEMPQWVDWVSVYRGLAVLWRWFHHTGRESETDYIRASRARDAMLAAAPLLTNKGLAWKPTPPERFRGVDYWDAFERDLFKLMGVFAADEATVGKT
jgi:hypothetical protein